MSEGDEADCDDLLDHLYELVDGELPDDAARIMTAHLRHCSHCREAVHSEVEVRRLLRRCWQVSAPRTLRLRIVERTTAFRGGA